MEKKGNNFGVYWTKEDDQLLKKLIEEDKLRYSEASRIINRTSGAVERRVAILKLNYAYSDRFRNDSWTEKDIQVLKELLKDPKNTWDDISKHKQFLGRHNFENIRHFYKKNRNSLSLKKINSSLEVGSENANKAIELYKTGEYSLNEIGEIIGISGRSVEHFFHKNNIKSDKKKGKKGVITLKKDIPKEVLEKELCKNKKSVREVARELGINEKVIYHRIKFFGLNLPDKKLKKEDLVHYKQFLNSKKARLIKAYLGEDSITPGRFQHIRIASVLPKERLESLWREGKNFKEIGIELGLGIWNLSKHIVQEAFRLNGIKIFPQDYSEDFWRKHYIEEGSSFEDLSELTGFCEATLRIYLRKLFPKQKPVLKGTTGERIIQRALNSLDLSYNRQYYLKPGEIYEHKVSIDFQVKKDNQEYWIEYNGSQHYVFRETEYRRKESKFGKPDRFKHQIERDKSIREYCKKNSIILIEIPYTYQSTKKVTEILTKILIDKESPEKIIDLSRFQEEVEQSLKLINKLEKEEKL